MDIILTLMLTVLTGVGAFVAGKWTDIYWRIKIKRQIQKKDYHIAEIVSKDKKSKTQQVFLPEQSMIWNGMESYTVENGRVYRTSKPDDGFHIGEENIRWKEGIPVLTIDADTFRPLDYDFKNTTGVKSGEVGAILKSWEVNQAAKATVTAFAEMKKAQTIVMIVLAVSVLCLLVAGLTFMDVGEMKKAIPSIYENAEGVKMLKNYIIPPELQNTTMNATGG